MLTEAHRKEIGNRIKQARDLRGLTLKEVGDMTGLAASTIQRYEKGAFTKIKMPLIKVIAEILEVDPAWLALESDDMEDEDLITLDDIPNTQLEALREIHNNDVIAIRRAWDHMQEISFDEIEQTESRRPSNTAERLKQAMQIRNMKQSELSAITGIGKSSISTYLSGEYLPKQRNVYKISKALDVSEAWLMGYDVPMERKEAEEVRPNFSDPLTDDLLAEVNRLSPDQKRLLLAQIRLMNEQSAK